MKAAEWEKLEEEMNRPLDPEVVQAAKVLIDAYAALESLGAAKLYDLHTELGWNLKNTFKEDDLTYAAREKLADVAEHALRQQLVREAGDDDYAFCVVGPGNEPWEVYRFVVGDRRGMMAVRPSLSGGYDIGLFEDGEFTPNEVARKLGGPERWAQ
jgi:hypothetical protein